MADITLDELTKRTQDIFHRVVPNYLEEGGAVGSSAIARQSDVGLSSASIRSIMSELEAAGLLYSPHRSAGRIPTQAGLRLFVDGLMQIRAGLSAQEQASISTLGDVQGGNVQQLMENAGLALSGLSKCASMIMAPTEDLAVDHIEFVPVQASRVLVILVFSNGRVENRLIDLPAGLPRSVLNEASAYMNSRYAGKSVTDISAQMKTDKDLQKTELDSLTSDLIDRGLASWTDGKGGADASLILNGQTNLLEDVRAVDDISRVRVLFDKLEMQTHASHLMQQVSQADGLQIFIGSDHHLFAETGCSMVLSPYRDSDSQIIGAVGVIGPRHMNYAKIIPMVDYTSKAIQRFLTSG